jgi:hypothetical protein
MVFTDTGMGGIWPPWPPAWPAGWPQAASKIARGRRAAWFSLVGITERSLIREGFCLKTKQAYSMQIFRAGSMATCPAVCDGFQCSRSQQNASNMAASRANVAIYKQQTFKQHIGYNSVR